VEVGVSGDRLVIVRWLGPADHPGAVRGAKRGVRCRGYGARTVFRSRRGAPETVCSARRG